MYSSAFAPVLPFCFKPGRVARGGGGFVNEGAGTWGCSPRQRADVPRAGRFLSAASGGASWCRAGPGRAAGLRPLCRVSN